MSLDIGSRSQFVSDVLNEISASASNVEIPDFCGLWDCAGARSNEERVGTILECSAVL